MENNYKKVQSILLIIFIANLLVALLKIILGSLIQSSSMTADGLHSFTDGTSNIVGLIGIKFASKPIDKEHPYGHNKFETLSTLFISVMLFIVGGNVIFKAILRFVSPIEPKITLECFIALIVTLIINIFVSVIEYRKGKELKSQILICDSIHTRSDIVVSIGVIVTLIGIQFGLPPIIDPIFSLVVAAFILRAALEICKENCNILVDRAYVDTQEIHDIIMNFDLVKDAHNIRSRGCSSNLFIDMHLMVEPKLSVEESHKLVHEIERTIQDKVNKNTQIITHLEPYSENHKEEEIS